MDIRPAPYHVEDAEVFVGPATEPWAAAHIGETAIVLGSGKSLRDIPITLLEKYPSFGVNFIYLLPFQPTYFCSIDKFYLKTHPKKMYLTASKAKLAFLSELMLGFPALGLRELYELENVCLFGEDTIRFPGEYCMSGETVAYVALKIAYVMGFNTVLLAGCDRDKNWEYFSEDYPAEHLDFRSKEDWEIKKRGMEYHFKLADDVYKKDGRSIVNLSLPSELDALFARGDIGDW